MKPNTLAKKKTTNVGRRKVILSTPPTCKKDKSFDIQKGDGMICINIFQPCQIIFTEADN